MSDDVKKAVEWLRTLDVDDRDYGDAQTLLAHLDAEPARLAAAREEQREACARHIREKFLEDLDIDADSACLDTPLDSTPLADRIAELEALVDEWEERAKTRRVRDPGPMEEEYE